MFLGIRGIEESWFYRDIYAEGESKGRAEGLSGGRAEEECSQLIRLRTARLGKPTAEVRAATEAAADIDRLETLPERLLTSSSRDDLGIGTTGD